MDQWFYLEADGSQRGPVPLDQLLAALRSRSAQTLVWRTGMAQWAPADSLPELRAALTPAAPMPPAPAAAPAPPARQAPMMGTAPLAPGAAAPGPQAGAPAEPGLNPFAPPDAASGVTARAYAPQPASLNPWTVFKRSFFPRGRFTRGEFAVAYFAPLGVVLLLYLFGFLLAALLGATGGKAGGGAAAMVIVLTFLPAILLALVTMYTNFAASIRRLIDRGHSPWMALLTLLPCANVIMLLYLFFAPTRDAEAEQVLATANTTPVLIALLAIPCVIGGIGIIAAIAIPSLLRARVSANESMAIGDIRTVISAEAAYQSNNSEYYDTLACLAAPKQCIPNYPPTGPTFIDPALASAETKGGYRRSFHAGPAPSRRPSASSPSSIESYAYVAVPLTQGQTGVRSFCGDASGLIWFDPNGKVPQVVDGKCDESWTPLR